MAEYLLLECFDTKECVERQNDEVTFVYLYWTAGVPETSEATGKSLPSSTRVNPNPICKLGLELTLTLALSVS